MRTHPRNWQELELGEWGTFLKGKKMGTLCWLDCPRWIYWPNSLLYEAKRPHFLLASSDCCFSVINILAFVQSLNIDSLIQFLVPASHLPSKAFPLSFTPHFPTRPLSPSHHSFFSPSLTILFLPPHLIATSLSISLLGCPEDFILVHTVSPIPRGLPGPRSLLKCLFIISSDKLRMPYSRSVTEERWLTVLEPVRVAKVLLIKDAYFKRNFNEDVSGDWLWTSLV